MSLKILNRYLSYSLLFVISSHIGRLPSWTFSSIMGWRNSKWMEQRNETCSDMCEFKRVWNGENAIVCWNWNKIPCGEAGYATANCAPARWLKIVLMDLTYLGCCCTSSQTSREWETNCCSFLSFSYAIHHVNELLRKKTSEKVIVSSEWNKIQLYFEAGHAMSRLCTGQASKALK